MSQTPRVEDVAIRTLQSPRTPLILTGGGLLWIILYALPIGGWRDSLSFATVVIMLGAASLVAGAFLGFLFGIPRAPQVTTAVEEGTDETETSVTTAVGVKYLANTNLEQISDWLTKILVGVGLTQIGSLPDAVRNAANGLQLALGNRPASGILGVASATYFLICGFLLGYLWTRTFLPRAFRWSESELTERVDTLAKQLKQGVAQVDTIAGKVDEIQRSLRFVQSPELTTDLQAGLERTLTDYTTYLQGLGFVPPPEGVGITVETAVGDNAYYDIEQNLIRIGPALARDPDAALREFTHHALFTLGRLREVGDLSPAGTAIESGLADYFPCSFTKDPLLGEHSAPVAFDRPFIRNLDNTLTFTSVPADKRGVSQIVGEVWGGTFWDLRKLLGQERADRLLMAAWSAAEEPALDQIEPADFVQRLLRALAVDGGPDLTAQVREIFVRRGISMDT